MNARFDRSCRSSRFSNSATSAIQDIRTLSIWPMIAAKTIKSDLKRIGNQNSAHPSIGTTCMAGISVIFVAGPGWAGKTIQI